MEGNIVRFRRQPNTPLSAKEEAELLALRDRPINFDDIPELDESFFKNAVRNPFYRPRKISAPQKGACDSATV